MRRRLKGLAGRYRNVMVVTHRGFCAFLVRGERFEVCERRGYRFAEEEEEEGKEGEMEGDEGRWGVNIDTGLRQDFGLTVLVPV